MLSGLADRITSDMVRSAYRSAVGPLSSEPITPYDLPSVIRVLESATTGANGLPPLLAFLEALARQLPEDAANNLRDWVNDFALRDDIPRHLISRLRLSEPRADKKEPTSYLLAELLDFGPDEARYLSRVTLLQGNRRRQPVDGVHLRHCELMKKAPGIGRHRLQVAPLRLRVERAESQRRLTRT